MFLYSLNRYRRSGFAVFAFTLFALNGCSRFVPGLGFSDVAGTVAERSGKTVIWRQDSESAQQIDAEVKSLLARKLTADSAAQIALLNNREMQAVYQRLGLSQADVLQARLPRNPSLSGDFRVAGDTGPNLGFSLVQNLFDLIALPFRTKFSEVEFEAMKVEVTEAVLDLEARTRLAFYDFQAAEQKNELELSNAAATAAACDLAERLHRAGNITDLALDSERLSREQSSLSVESQKFAVVQARERLNALMGLSESDASRWSAGEGLGFPDSERTEVEDIEALAIARNLALESSRLRIEAAGMRLNIARPSQLWSDIDSGVSAEREDGDWHESVGFSLPIPLFDQGQAEKARAQAELQTLLNSHQALIVAVQAAARTARARLAFSERQMKGRKHTVIPIRRRILQQTQKQYNGMLSSAFELLKVRQELTEEKIRYIDDLLEYWRARTTLEAIINGLTVADISMGTGRAPQLDLSNQEHSR